METVDRRALPTVPTAPTAATAAVSILPRFPISAPKGDTFQLNTTTHCEISRQKNWTVAAGLFTNVFPNRWAIVKKHYRRAWKSL